MIDFTEYIVLLYFSTFLPLGERSKWSLLLNILFFFDFSTSLLEGQTYRLYWIILILLTFRLFDLRVGEINMIDFTEYIGFFRLFVLLVGCQNDRLYWTYCIFVVFRLFDLLVGDQNDKFHWIYLDSFDFSTSWWVVKKSILLQHIVFLWFFEFLTSLWGNKMIDFTEYIVFSTFWL